MNISNEFRNNHTKSGTIWGHLIALIVFSFGYINLLYPTGSCVYIILLFLAIYLVVSIKLTIIYAIILSLLYSLVKFIESNNFKYSNTSTRVFISILIIAIGYLITDVSHLYFNEKTYSSTYKNKKNKYNKKVIHHFLLPLLILDSAFYKKTMFGCGKINIDNEAQSYLITYMNNLVADKKKDIINVYLKDSDINFDIINKIRIDEIISDFYKQNNLDHQKIKHSLTEDIDELYSTNKKYLSNKTSKSVEEYHIDGHIPNIFFGIKTFRILILIDKDTNDNSYTNFFEQNKCDGNYWVFDYNRQVHKGVLDTNPSITKDRILLKKHFIIYPAETNPKILEKYTNFLITSNKNMRKLQNKKYSNIVSKIYIAQSKLKNKLMEPLSINEY